MVDKDVFKSLLLMAGKCNALENDNIRLSSEVERINSQIESLKCRVSSNGPELRSFSLVSEIKQSNENSLDIRECMSSNPKGVDIVSSSSFAGKGNGKLYEGATFNHNVLISNNAIEILDSGELVTVSNVSKKKNVSFNSLISNDVCVGDVLKSAILNYKWEEALDNAEVVKTQQGFGGGAGWDPWVMMPRLD